MKLWVDDMRTAPPGYVWCQSVNQAKHKIETIERRINRLNEIQRERHLDPSRWINIKIEIINIDHDAGEYANDGGDYICLLDWLEQTGRNYPICIHSMNPVGVENMRRIIRRNGWTEVKEEY